MAKEFAKSLYQSTAWISTRNAYFKSKQGLCERCLKQNKIVVGEIVHHKEYITPQNINNPDITLNWNNLELVCRECHKKEHDGNLQSISEGLIFNENGDIVNENESNIF